MKNNPILRWFVVGIVHFIMYVLGVVLFPIYYPFNRLIADRKIWFLWWFLNDNESDRISNIYGDLGWRQSIGFNYSESNIFSRAFVGFRWLALRNSHWNFRIHVLQPKQGEMYGVEIIHNDTQPVTSGLTFCNFSIWGKQYAKYHVGNYKYFRYSFTKPTPKFLQFLGFNEMWNLHSGWTPGRWILKLRFFNK